MTPGVDQSDILKCDGHEYGDQFSILGTSASRAGNLDARLRYQFGWLGKDDIAVVNRRSITALSPLNAANREPSAAAPTPTHPVAAVIPESGLWMEWRDSMDTAAGGLVLVDNPGLWIRKHQVLADVNLQTCDNNQWTVVDTNGDTVAAPERNFVTLNAGRTLVLRSQGVLIQVCVRVCVRVCMCVQIDDRHPYTDT